MFQRLALILCATLALSCPASSGEAEPGGAAPNCKMTPIGGGPNQDLQQYRGKIVYVDFWASWCGPCTQSFPFMNEIHRDFRDKGVSVLAVNLDDDPEDAKAFLANHPAEFKVMVDTGGDCPQKFGVKAMPSSYLVDRDGVIRQVHLGFRPGEAQQFRASVEALLARPATAHP